MVYFIYYYSPERVVSILTMSYFGNDKYRVLECLYKRQVQIGNEKVSKLSQEEIGKIVGLSKTKVNSIINELKNNNYLEKNTPKGKYVLTDNANVELKKIANGEAVK